MPKSYFMELKAPLNQSIRIINKLHQFFEKEKVIDHEFDLFINDDEGLFFIFVMAEQPDILERISSEFSECEIKDSTICRYRKIAKKRMESRIIEETKKYLLTSTGEISRSVVP